MKAISGVSTVIAVLLLSALGNADGLDLYRLACKGKKKEIVDALAKDGFCGTVGTFRLGNTILSCMPRPRAATPE